MDDLKDKKAKATDLNIELMQMQEKLKKKTTEYQTLMNEIIEAENGE